jgi:isocitrate/isopropylmalate dehydrogenase
MEMKIALLPGDGIGPEIVAEAIKVLKGLDEQFKFEEAPFGGAGYEASGRRLLRNTRGKPWPSLDSTNAQLTGCGSPGVDRREPASRGPKSGAAGGKPAAGIPSCAI